MVRRLPGQRGPGAGPGGARTPGGHSGGTGIGHCASAPSLRPHPGTTPGPFRDNGLPFCPSLLREEAEGAEGRPSLLRAPGCPAARCEGSSRESPRSREEGRRAAHDRAPSGEHEALGATSWRVEGPLCTQPPAQRSAPAWGLGGRLSRGGAATPRLPASRPAPPRCGHLARGRAGCLPGTMARTLAGPGPLLGSEGSGRRHCSSRSSRHPASLALQPALSQSESRSGGEKRKPG
ncbi:unnamed protein product [Rangifer tarandus platyrhynchus]|uniref:Uncharacterized protein n=1 Tax=Rangifer tarandus platyrhynchus TaxID=3082113 RepID=A0AC59ZAU5_RANTA